MQRRALLACFAGTAALSGCSSILSGRSKPRDVTLTRGSASVRPIDEPWLQGGLTSAIDTYLWARLYDAGDSIATTDAAPDWLAGTVEGLSENQFALLLNLRTGSEAPAYFEAKSPRLEGDRFHVDAVRATLSDPDPIDAPEAVGVSVFAFEVIDGDVPRGGEVRFPGGATFSVGAQG